MNSGPVFSTMLAIDMFEATDAQPAGNRSARGTRNGGPVTVTGSASALPGIQSVLVNAVAAAVSGSTWTASVPLTFGQNTITVSATSNAGTSSESSQTVIYALAPTATHSTPASGGPCLVGQVVASQFGCAEGSGGPGLASCTESGGAGAGSGQLPTNTVGQHTYTVTATSKDGLAKSTNISYTVAATPVPTGTPAATQGPLGAPAAMTVSIGTVRARYQAGHTQIELICTGPAAGVCRGTLTLTTRVRRTVFRRIHGTRRQVTVLRTITIGQAGYSLAEAESALVTVRLAQGLPRTIHAHAIASGQGASPATGKLTLVPAPEPNRHKHHH